MGFNGTLVAPADEGGTDIRSPFVQAGVQLSDHAILENGQVGAIERDWLTVNTTVREGRTGSLLYQGYKPMLKAMIHFLNNADEGN